MGFHLYSTFLDAGLPAPQLYGEANILAGPEWANYDWPAETIRSLLPLILKFGLTTAEEIDIDTLAERIRNEALAYRLTVRGPDNTFAWTRKL
jgi:hypothetical protein